MKQSNEKLLLVCDDEILKMHINKILSTLKDCRSKHISINEFNYSLSLVDSIKYILIDERKNVSKLLGINKMIKNKFSHIKLLIVTNYLEGEFADQFTSSGVDFVVPIVNLKDRLLNIFNSNVKTSYSY